VKKFIIFAVTPLLLTACQTTQQNRLVNMSDITTDASQPQQAQNFYAYDIQPRNRSESCLVKYSGYEFVTSPISVQDINLEWDGNCQNGKAVGVGKLTQHNLNATTESIVNFNAAGVATHFASIPSAHNNFIANYGGNFYDGTGKLIATYSVREFKNTNTDQMVTDGYFKNDYEKNLSTGVFIKFYNNGYSRFSGSFGKYFKGGIEHFNNSNIKQWDYWGYYNLANDKYVDYGITNQAGVVTHAHYKYGQLNEYVTLSKDYIEDINATVYHAQEDANLAQQYATYAKNMVVSYNNQKTLANSKQKKEAPKPQKTVEPKGNGLSIGSGFFVSDDGFLITNSHVLEDKRDFHIVINGSELEAKLIDADLANDIALLKVQAKTKGLSIEVKEKPRKGEKTIAIGFPNVSLQGFEKKVTMGNINSQSGIKGDSRFLQISNPIQPGNSGGPLLNSKGEVIGIVTATLNQESALKTTGTMAQNVNYALKIAYVLPILISNDVNYKNLSASVQSDVKIVEKSDPSVVMIIAE